MAIHRTKTISGILQGFGSYMAPSAMTMGFFYFTILWSLVLVASGCGQNNGGANKEEVLHEQLDSLFQAQYHKGRFNGSVLIVKDGTTLYESSFGYMDGTKTVHLDKSYRFNMGSIYKEFPAVAIMQLVEKGQVDIADKIGTYLPELPDWSDQISIKHLLQYTSGLPKVNWSKHQNIGDADVMSDLLGLEKLLSVPGEEYLYTNNSPFLLIKMVERISHMDFKTYAQHHLFSPYGLENTLIKERYPYQDKHRMAIPFDTEYREDTFPIHISSILICSTPRDMFHWLEQLHTFKILDKNSLLTLAEKSGSESANIQSPLGHILLNQGVIKEHIHHGSSGNFEALISRYNDLGLTVLMMTNQKNGNLQSLTASIIKMLEE